MMKSNHFRDEPINVLAKTKTLLRNMKGGLAICCMTRNPAIYAELFRFLL